MKATEDFERIRRVQDIRDKAEAMHVFHLELKHEESPIWSRTFRENRLRWLMAEQELQQI
jgi:hypothetical protein